MKRKKRKPSIQPHFVGSLSIGVTQTLRSTPAPTGNIVIIFAPQFASAIHPYASRETRACYNAIPWNAIDPHLCMENALAGNRPSLTVGSTPTRVEKTVAIGAHQWQLRINPYGGRENSALRNKQVLRSDQPLRP